MATVAEAVGTPVYVYSAGLIEENYRRLRHAFDGVPHLICYSVKANSNLAVLRTMRRQGAGFDIVSGGELDRVLCAGAGPGRVVYSGVGKTTAEMDFALRKEILAFNIESVEELQRLAECARRRRRRARVLVRVNPDVDPHTHPHISTGRHAHKFGVPWREVVPVCLQAAALPSIELMGLACHIGSQITRLRPFEQALSRLRALSVELKRAGMPIRLLDFGGGIGIRYRHERTVPLAGYARRVKRLVQALGCRLLLEPGRVIAGPAGVLLAQVLLEKDTPGRRFVVVDAGMSDFLRPALYGAAHRIEPVEKRIGPRSLSACDVVGPLCETADALGRNIWLPRLEPGALLAVRDAGAYGFVLSSNYNARRRPAEVMVRGDRFRVVRRRESQRDLLRGET